jgi:hypothetical protein
MKQKPNRDNNYGPAPANPMKFAGYKSGEDGKESLYMSITGEDMEGDK